MNNEHFNSPQIMESSTLPWSSVLPKSIIWKEQNTHPSVVRFTGGGFDFPAKRKHSLKLDSSESPPCKQMITEEKMAAHMSQLHISDTTVPLPSTSMHEEEAPSKLEDFQLPRLYVCEEVRKLKHEPIVPVTLLQKIVRPQMAVVLWQPPVGVTEELNFARHSKQAEIEQTEDEEMMVDSNNTDPRLERIDLTNIFRPIDPAPSGHQTFAPSQFQTQIIYPAPLLN